MTKSTTLHLDLDDNDVELLGTTLSRVFVAEQPGRFEPHGDGDPESGSWDDGTMTWCAAASDAVLLRAYERATGHDAMILWDAGVDEMGRPLPDPWVVLSTRPFPW